MKQKARKALIIAGLILAVLIAGKLDNDYTEQHNTPREGCTQITTADGTGVCR